jgi:hypothetical protein
MDAKKPVLIELENLLVDIQNPRYNPLRTQRESLIAIAVHKKSKLSNLADDMLDKGPNPSELLMVTPSEDDPKYFIVLEGNRRIAALKLLASDSLTDSLDIPVNLKKKLALLRAEAGQRIPRQIACVVLPREEANYWIQLKHTGENEGVGAVMWDGPARHRFRGNSPALQAIDLVAKTKYINEETRNKLPGMSITNVERILGTPEARKLLQVDVKNRHLSVTGPEEEVLKRLAFIVTDIANKNSWVCASLM